MFSICGRACTPIILLKVNPGSSSNNYALFWDEFCVFHARFEIEKGCTFIGLRASDDPDYLKSIKICCCSDHIYWAFVEGIGSHLWNVDWKAK